MLISASTELDESSLDLLWKEHSAKTFTFRSPVREIEAYNSFLRYFLELMNT